jgi:sec1 family domain-containing protein 1
LLDEINKRTLDTFFELEGKIMDHAYSSTSASTAADYKPALLGLLKGEGQTAGGDRRGAGTPNDRLRLFLIFYFVFGSHLTESDMAEYQAVLTNMGVALAPLEYAQVLCGYSHDRGGVPNESSLNFGATGSKRALISGLMTNVMTRGYRGIASVAQNAKNLIMDKRRSLACARVLDVFTDDRARAANVGMADDVLENYLIFDPKAHAELDVTSRDRMKHMVFADAVLFVIGGGNYVEYENCMTAIHSDTGSDQRRNLIYGATQLLNADHLMHQLKALHTG